MAMAVTNAQVAPRYAKALYEAAADKQQLTEVHTDLQALQNVIAANADLMSVLASNVVKSSDKQALLKTLTDGATPLTSDFISLVFDYGRISALSLIIAAFEQTYAKAQGVLEATVVTATPLASDQAEKLSQAVATKFGAKTVQLTQQVDPSVIGGVKIMSADRIIDGTVATRLKQLQAQLLVN